MVGVGGDDEQPVGLLKPRAVCSGGVVAALLHCPAKGDEAFGLIEGEVEAGEAMQRRSDEGREGGGREGGRKGEGMKKLRVRA